MLLAGLLFARESRRPGPIGGIDRAFFDWLGANVRPNGAPASGGVTLVEIDDAVIDAPGRWPFSPLDYALFLQSAQKMEPAVIAIEPILNWTKAQPGNDEILVNQALTAPKLLLSAQLGSAQGLPDAAPLAPLARVTGNVGGVPEFPEIVAAPHARIFPLAVCGVTNLSAPGPPLREIPLLFRRRAEVLPSFTLQAVGLWLQFAPSEISAEPGVVIHLGPERTIAIDRAGKALLDATAYPRINRVALDDLQLLTSGVAAASPATAAAAARMKGGLVILGRTDRAARVYLAPWGGRISAAETLAWGAASLRASPTLRRAGLGWDAAITLAAALLAPTLSRLSRRRTAAAGFGAVAAYALAGLGAFEMSNLWVPFALPLGLTLCACVVRCSLGATLKATSLGE